MSKKTYKILDKMLDKLGSGKYGICLEYIDTPLEVKKILKKYSNKLLSVEELKNWEKQFDTPEYLNQTILLNWLREWTDLYDKGKERDFARILGNLIKQKIREVIDNE